MNYRQLRDEIDMLTEEEMDQEIAVIWKDEVYGIEYAVLNDDEDMEVEIGQFVLHAE